MAEQEAVSFARSFGLGLVRLRLFNVYGPRQGPRAAGPNVGASWRPCSPASGRSSTTTSWGRTT